MRQPLRASHAFSRPLALSLVLVLGVVASPTPASAFCRSTTCNPKKSPCEVDDEGCVTGGVPVRWETNTLVYRFHEASSSTLVREEARAAVRAAFHRWSDTICPDGRRTSLRFVEGEDIAEDKPLENGTQAAEPFGIYFRDLGWPHDGADETLALTNYLPGKNTGRITYADIEVNTTKPFAVDELAPAHAVDLQSVMTHEVGHYIGLAHSRAPRSIMAERYCQLDDRCAKGRVAARRLAEDDIEAVCTLYPPGVPSGPPARDLREPETGACTFGSGTASSTPLGLGVLLGVVAVVRRTRDRRRT